jgi:hypothetical protein
MCAQDYKFDFFEEPCGNKITVYSPGIKREYVFPGVKGTIKKIRKWTDEHMLQWLEVTTDIETRRYSPEQIQQITARLPED